MVIIQFCQIHSDHAVLICSRRFMPADSLWALCMACNVYLALFHHYNTEHLRPLEWKYFLFCYGLPFIPAFVFFFIQGEDNGKVYGLAIVSSNSTALHMQKRSYSKRSHSNGAGSHFNGTIYRSPCSTGQSGSSFF